MVVQKIPAGAAVGGALIGRPAHHFWRDRDGELKCKMTTSLASNTSSVGPGSMHPFGAIFWEAVPSTGYQAIRGSEALEDSREMLRDIGACNSE